MSYDGLIQRQIAEGLRERIAALEAENTKLKKALKQLIDAIHSKEEA